MAFLNASVQLLGEISLARRWDRIKHLQVENRRKWEVSGKLPREKGKSGRGAEEDERRKGR